MRVSGEDDVDLAFEPIEESRRVHEPEDGAQVWLRDRVKRAIRRRRAARRVIEPHEPHVVAQQHCLIDEESNVGRLEGRALSAEDVVRVLSKIKLAPVHLKDKESVPSRPSVWFVESGEMLVTPKRRKRVRLGTGDFFGGECLISPFKASVTAVANGDVVLYEMPSEDCRVILTELDLIELLNESGVPAAKSSVSSLGSRIPSSMVIDVPGKTISASDAELDLRVDADRLLTATSNREANLTTIVNLLLFMGIPANVTTLRTALGNLRLTYLRVAEIIEPYGVSARPTKVSVKTLPLHRYPAIIALKGRLFVVLRADAKRQSVIVHDPIRGFLELTFKELEENWEGMMLEALAVDDEGADTDRPNEKPALRDTPTGRLLLAFLAEHRGLMLNLALLSGLSIALGVVQPWLSQLVLDEVLTLRDMAVLTSAAAGILISAVLFAGIRFIQQIMFADFVKAFDSRVGVQFYRRALGLPLSFFSKHKAGDVLTRLHDIEEIREFLSWHSLQVIVDVFSIFVTTALLAFYGGAIALLALGVGVAIFVFQLAIGGTLYRNYTASARAATQSTSLIAEQVAAVGTIKAFGAARVLREKWERVYLNARQLSLKNEMIATGSSVFLEILSAVARIGGIYLAARLALAGSLSAGQVLAISIYLNHVVEHMSEIGAFSGRVWRVRTDLDNVRRIMDAPQEIPKKKALTTLSAPLDGKIKIENLGFRYSEETDWVLRDINLTIYPRQIVALVGRSGCGKTTLAHLIAGNLKPTSGRIVYDGIDGAFMSQTSLRRHVGFVMQQYQLFHAGIGENIAFADDAPRDDRVNRAAYDAHVQPFVTVLPAGMKTVLGEGGTGLSGGQAQRLSIARTLYRDPTILIFDEATSQLDAESEQAIVGNMQRFVSGRTSIIIAHRLSTIRQADVIYVMKDGMIVEEGTHETLVKSGGHYAELFAAQAAGLEG